MAEPGKFEGWAIVEIMGHQTYSGFVSEQVIGGAALVRVDVPGAPITDGDGKIVGEQDGAFTKMFGLASIYCITPVAEEFARRAIARTYSKPVSLYMPEYQGPITERPVGLLTGRLVGDEDYAPDPFGDDPPYADEDRAKDWELEKRADEVAPAE